MKALVISGGGNKGAYAGGVAEFLIKNCGREYDFIIGTSTGSLLAPLLALGDVDRLREVFTNISQKDIFKICPFIIRKKKSMFQVSMNHFGILRMFMRGEKTFGDSSNLKKLLYNVFTESDFERLRQSDKLVVVTVANLTEQKVEYKTSDDCKYDEFINWIWASANLLPFMSMLVQNDCEYGDGGFGNVIPIQEAINMGATDIDVIALRPIQKVITSPRASNAFNVLTKTFDFMLNQIGLDDLIIGKLEAKHRKVDIHFFHTPRILTEQIFVFDPEQLAAWWEEGYEIALQSTPPTQCIHPEILN